MPSRASSQVGQYFPGGRVDVPASLVVPDRQLVAVPVLDGCIGPPDLVVGGSQDAAELGTGDGAADGDVDMGGEAPLGFDGGEVLHVLAEVAAQVLDEPVEQRGEGQRVAGGLVVVVGGGVDRDAARKPSASPMAQRGALSRPPSSPSNMHARRPPMVISIRPARLLWPPTTSGASTTPSASARPSMTSAAASAPGHRSGSPPNSTSDCTAHTTAGRTDAHRDHRAPRAASRYRAPGRPGHPPAACDLPRPRCGGRKQSGGRRRPALRPGRPGRGRAARSHHPGRPLQGRAARSLPTPLTTRSCREHPACTASTGSSPTRTRTWRPAGPCWTGPSTCSPSGTANPPGDTAGCRRGS